MRDRNTYSVQRPFENGRRGWFDDEVPIDDGDYNKGAVETGQVNFSICLFKGSFVDIDKALESVRGVRAPKKEKTINSQPPQ